MDTVLEKQEEQRNKSWWMEPLKINKMIIPFKIDTGANVNIIGKEEFNNLKERPALKESQVKLTAYEGSEVPVCGQFIADIRHKGEKLQEFIHSLKCCRATNYRDRYVRKVEPGQTSVDSDRI